ncbi:hypothetical protein Tco_1176807 [Tanacetum coccineum]
MVRHEAPLRPTPLPEIEEKSLIYNTSFLGEYECSSLALDRRRKKIRLDHLKQGNNVVFIARKNPRLLKAVPEVPDISGGRPAYQGAAPR